MTKQRQFCEHCGAVFAPLHQLDSTCPSCLLRMGVETIPVSGPEADRRIPKVEDVAALLPGYEVFELIGSGGMGAVYRARHRKLGRTVALKVLLPSLGSDEAFSARFLREARALANLSHSGIVTIYDFGTVEDLYFFAMEFVDGVSLRELMAENEIDCGLALEIVKQVCQALHYAHENGVVHRDIKPDNILLNSDGVVKITDFGLAKLANSDGDRHLTRTDQVMGTPHYMAPEQIEKPATVDHRADLYSLGVVFYELLAGELPLGRFTPPSHNSKLDPRLDKVVLRALEKNPVNRYQSANHMHTDLAGLANLSAAAVVRKGAESVSRAVSQVAHYGEQLDIPSKVDRFRSASKRVQERVVRHSPRLQKCLERGWNGLRRLLRLLVKVGRIVFDRVLRGLVKIGVWLQGLEQWWKARRG